MPGTMNKAIYVCDECGKVLDEKIETCWSGKWSREYTPDHFGLCCDCFDVSLGMKPPIILGLRTVSDTRYDEDDNN